MAKFDVYDSVGGIMNSFDLDFDDICESALNEAAPKLETAMKASARSSIMHDGESDMVESIKIRGPKKARNGCWIVNVGPSGYSSHKYYAVNGKGIKTSRSYPVSNALKAIWKEYGITGQHNQPAQPFIQKACNQVEAAVLDIFQNTFNKKADK